MMGYILGGMILFSVVTGAMGGRMEQVSAAAMTGCGDAVQLAISLAGTLCLWSGVMRIADKSGITTALSRLLRPVTRLLFREIPQHSAAMKAICMNMAANLLGLGNAATPFGIRAAKGMAERYRGRAGDGLCLLVVCNTASIQLLPTTVAAIRSAAGCASPFDILPAVWLSSALALGAGLAAAKLLGRVWPP